MKKVVLLLLVFPVFLFSQNTLVSWFNNDFTPAVHDSHLNASRITAKNVSLSNEVWGTNNIFYLSREWPQPDYNNTGVSMFNPSKYIEFSVSPKADYKITLSSFNFNGRMQADQAYMQVRYSKSSSFNTFKVLQAETTLTSSYKNFNLAFNEPATVSSGEKLYIRVYVYSTNQAFHIQHNQSGSIAPYLSGSVSLEAPVAPIANNDSAGTVKNSPVTIEIPNSTNQYSGPISAVNIVSAPKHGSVQLNGVTSFKYTPQTGYTGYDHFSYSLTNAVGVSNVAKVDVQVIDGNEKVLTRWKNENRMPTDVAAAAAGKTLSVSNQTIRYVQHVEGTSRPAFAVGGLAKPEEFDKHLDPSKYTEAAISASSSEHSVLVKKLMMKYRGAGTGNITIKYSKTADFSGTVTTLIDNESYATPWVNTTLALPSGVFLYPGEQLFFRIYTYNTNNEFFVEISDDFGMALSGIVAPYAAAPCQTTAVWTKDGWIDDIKPNNNIKAEIQADYNTATHGSFEACSLTVSSGKLTVEPGNPVTVQNEINVKLPGSLEVQNDASLVQNNDAAVNTGNITVKRNARMKRLDYTYWASPVEGQKLKAFSPATVNERFYTYDEATDIFVKVNDPVNTVFGNSSSNTKESAAKGYSIRASNSYPAATPNAPAPEQTFVGIFTGVPNNGAIAFDMKKSRNGYNLVGNPYASNIDFSELVAANEGMIDHVAYFWTNVNAYTNTGETAHYTSNNYAQLVGGTGNPAAGRSKTPSQIIRPGQGFIVRAAKEGTLNFTNAIRTADPDAVFFNKVSPKDRYWLQLTTPLNNVNTTAIAYTEGATDGFDRNYDGSLMVVGSDSFYSVLGERKLAIQGRQYPVVLDDVVPLGAVHYGSGLHTISITKKEGIFANGQAIYLNDKHTGIITDLSQSDYTFSTEAGESSGRFEIVYRPQNVLATDNAVKEELVIYREQGDFVISSKLKKITEVEVFDISGKLINKVRANSTKVIINADTLSHGVYIIRINQSGQITGKKIIK